VVPDEIVADTSEPNTSANEDGEGSWLINKR
jgi:hypothetical protein